MFTILAPLLFHRVTQNGNSLFNSCSVSLLGDESLSLQLRCRTSLELFEHAQYYANHPLLFGHNVNGENKSAEFFFLKCNDPNGVELYDKAKAGRPCRPFLVYQICFVVPEPSLSNANCNRHFNLFANL